MRFERMSQWALFQEKVEVSEMRADIVPGAHFPDYELPDQTGKRRHLSVLQGGDPMILMLLRGLF